jgi:hypothetical protein
VKDNDCINTYRGTKRIDISTPRKAFIIVVYSPSVNFQTATNMDNMHTAPIYSIAPRNVVAVEHPMIVRNLENGLRTFGNGPAFPRVSVFDHVQLIAPLGIVEDEY